MCAFRHGPLTGEVADNSGPMKRLHYETTIAAPRQLVWETMLAPDSYRIWTAPFSEGSYFEGGWEKGDRIRFLAPDGNGLTAVIDENRPGEFLSIRHLGIIKDGVDDTESEEAKKFAPAFENYTFADADGGTRLSIDLDVSPEFEPSMNEMWPKALEKLRELCER
jgi:uncharacterized protein YndB with AHSA1/START domain